MKRREFISLLGGAAATWPLVARAQQSGRMPRVAVLMATAESDPEIKARVHAFRQRLQELGWTDGRNIRIDYRFAAGDPTRLQAYAAELVGLAPDVIFLSSPPTLRVVREQTRTIPIVFVGVADPVGAGFVESLIRPGGNMTGFHQLRVLHCWEVASAAQRTSAPNHPSGGPSQSREPDSIWLFEDGGCDGSFSGGSGDRHCRPRCWRDRARDRYDRR